MQSTRQLVTASVLLVSVAVPLGSPAGAAGYDFSNPSSTGCVTKGMLEVPATARTFGAFTIRLRRSTGCNTVWALVKRTDTKKCMQSGLNCAKVRLTRVLANGTKSATAWRKMPDGAKGVLSFQLIGLRSSAFTGTFATFGGKYLGASGTLKVDQNGTWTTS